MTKRKRLPPVSKGLLGRRLPRPPTTPIEVALWGALLEMSCVSEEDLDPIDCRLLLFSLNNGFTQEKLVYYYWLRRLILMLFEASISMVEFAQVAVGPDKFFSVRFVHLPIGFATLRENVRKGILVLREFLKDLRWIWLPWTRSYQYQQSRLLTPSGGFSSGTLSVAKYVLRILFSTPDSCDVFFPLFSTDVLLLKNLTCGTKFGSDLESNLLPGVFGGLRLPLR